MTLILTWPGGGGGGGGGEGGGGGGGGGGEVGSGEGIALCKILKFFHQTKDESNWW